MIRENINHTALEQHIFEQVHTRVTNQLAYNVASLRGEMITRIEELNPNVAQLDQSTSSGSTGPSSPSLITLRSLRHDIIDTQTEIVRESTKTGRRITRCERKINSLAVSDLLFMSDNLRMLPELLFLPFNQIFIPWLGPCDTTGCQQRLNSSRYHWYLIWPANSSRGAYRYCWGIGYRPQCRHPSDPTRDARCLRSAVYRYSRFLFNLIVLWLFLFIIFYIVNNSTIYSNYQPCCHSNG